jgi:hypothetical protein
MILRRLLTAFMLIFPVAAAGVHAYSLSPYKWPTATVRYYVNPKSIDLSGAVVTSAIQAAANVWNSQSRANIDLRYAGSTTASALTLNYKNEVFARNASSGSTFARTYSYWDSAGRRLDSDIIFYEKAFKFFSVSGCSRGIYLEDAAAHEFGHMLGMKHSSISGATMAPVMPSYCDRTWLTLALDDIAGLEKLYKPLLSLGAPPLASRLVSASRPAD